MHDKASVIERAAPAAAPNSAATAAMSKARERIPAIRNALAMAIAAEIGMALEEVMELADSGSDVPLKNINGFGTGGMQHLKESLECRFGIVLGDEFLGCSAAGILERLPNELALLAKRRKAYMKKRGLGALSEVLREMM